MILEHPLSAEVQVFPFKRDRIFTCMAFREPFTKALRDALICTALNEIPHLAAEEKNAADCETFNIELTKQGLVQFPWDGPPHLALICSHGDFSKNIMHVLVGRIKQCLAGTHEYPYSILALPRIIFQAVEHLPCVRIVKSVIPGYSVN